MQISTVCLEKMVWTLAGDNFPSFNLNLFVSYDIPWDTVNKTRCFAGGFCRPLRSLAKKTICSEEQNAVEADR